MAKVKIKLKSPAKSMLLFKELYDKMEEVTGYIVAQFSTRVGYASAESEDIKVLKKMVKKMPKEYIQSARYYGSKN